MPLERIQSRSMSRRILCLVTALIVGLSGCFSSEYPIDPFADPILMTATALVIAATRNAQPTLTHTPRPTSTITLTPTPVPLMFTLFRDTDSLTLYIADGQRADLAGISFGVGDFRYPVNSFPSFDGLPFDNLPTPICLRLELAGSSQPIPLTCPAADTITQRLASADGFWSNANQDRTIIIWRGENAVEFCPPNQARCEVTISSV